MDAKIKKLFLQGPSLPGPDLAFKAGVPQTPLPKYHRQQMRILGKSRSPRRRLYEPEARAGQYSSTPIGAKPLSSVFLKIDSFENNPHN